MSRSFSISTLTAASFCIGCVLLASNILLGDLNQDEGWYLYAARMVRNGEIPYRDFAYTQAPIMPFVYSIADPLVHRHGLIAGRFFTAALGMGAALMAAGLAAQLSGQGKRLYAATLVLILTLINVYQAYFFAVVKTYALTAFFLMAGFLALRIALDRKSRGIIALSGILMVMAACTRTSAAIVLPIVFFFLCFERNSRSFRGWLWFGSGGVPAAFAIILPFIIMAPESFWFCTVAYHTLRESGSVIGSLIYKAGFISRMVGAYFVAIGLCAAVILAQLLRFFFRKERGADERMNTGHTDVTSANTKSAQRSRLAFVRLIWAVVAAVTCVHFMAPFPYDDYQVFIFPLFAVSVSTAVIHLLCRTRYSITKGVVEQEKRAGTGTVTLSVTNGLAGSWLLLLIFGLSMGAALSSPLNQDWFILGRDRIWWRLKEQTPLAKLRETGKLIRDMTQSEDMLLTQDPYLAVESGLKLPRGLEMGQFSYFPDFSDEKARNLHVMNRARLTKLLRETDAPVAALSGYTFAIRSPQIEPVTQEEQDAFWSEINQRYEPYLDVKNFGQAFTTLRIFKKITPEFAERPFPKL